MENGLKRTVGRAFTTEGNCKDILVVSPRQVHKKETRVKEPIASASSGLLGNGGRIAPADFPEMESFEVVVEYE